MTSHKPSPRTSSVYAYNITLDKHGYFEANVSRVDGRVVWEITTARAEELKINGDIVDIRNPEQVSSYLKRIGLIPADAEILMNSDAEKRWKEDQIVTFDLSNFHGFYESVHDQYIDNAISEYFADDGGDVHIPDGFWSKYALTKEFANAYCTEYVKHLVQYIKEDKGFELPSMKFEKLFSPREYNFTTDVISVSVDAGELERQISRWMSKATPEDYADARKYIASKLETRPGFASFHDDVVARSRQTDNVFEWLGDCVENANKGVVGVILTSVLGELDEEEILNVFNSPFSETVSGLVYRHMSKECREMVDEFSNLHRSHYEI